MCPKLQQLTLLFIFDEKEVPWGFPRDEGSSFAGITYRTGWYDRAEKDSLVALESAIPTWVDCEVALYVHKGCSCCGCCLCLEQDQDSNEGASQSDAQ